eukprot:TRINITY_DN564_c0_g1_i3.p1 TRINITY_DN564_c0_g1~~TRINITY_DN564_c0_g1_i3.p1  ORF type:complete len:976 (+),score=247.26 TRINITY_DN564_c0_g1_i3:106-3033(+)
MEKIPEPSSQGGGIFSDDSDGEKHANLAQMLDSNDGRQKMDAMKRIITAMSKGKDVSGLFPYVVKNVVSDSLEIKRLVNNYVIHYAELEPDAALLAINSFQKDLKDHNQLVRGLALRVLSSIRLHVITQIVVISVQQAVKDSSPYVRKAAAHAISKVYSLDQEQEEVLINLITAMLDDKSTMVLGSVVGAFCEVCPDRFDLIHPHFRKLCSLLADLDEWGQIITINMLVRYGRTQFTNPDADEDERRRKKKKGKKGGKGKRGRSGTLDNFYSDDEDEDDEDDDSSDYDDDFGTDPLGFGHEMDPDHRLLIKSTLPLLQSRNVGVVMAVASLFYYLAPKAEASKAGRSLARLVRSRREIQYVVLSNIATMASGRPEVFASCSAEFFVQSTDVRFVRDLKLEILTYLADQSNCSRILRELNNYVRSEDKEFARSSIQAIGRIAMSMPDLADSCMHGIICLMNHRSEEVVAEAVVVMKKLLQLEQIEGKDRVIRQMSKMFDRIQLPEARASVVWVVGEYCDRIPLYAPDIFRKLAKSFPEEDNTVKLQVLNLGAKLSLQNPDQTLKIFEYVLNLAKYDRSYDVRDKARLVKNVFRSSQLRSEASSLFRNAKPTPTTSSISVDRQRFALGSLSHMVNHTVVRYQPILDFVAEAPDPSVRDVVAKSAYEREIWESAVTQEDNGGRGRSGSGGAFYSDEEDDGFYSDDSRRGRRRSRSGSRSRSRSRSGSYSRSRSRSRSYSGSRSRSPSYSRSRSPRSRSPRSRSRSPSGGGRSRSRSPRRRSRSRSRSRSPSYSRSRSRSPGPASDDPFASFLGDGGGSGGGGGGGGGGADSFADDLASLSVSSPQSVPSSADAVGPRSTLVSSVAGGGLQIEAAFQRKEPLHGSAYSGVRLTFVNKSGRNLGNIRLDRNSLDKNVDVVPFAELTRLAPGATSEATLSVKFSSPSQQVKLNFIHDGGRCQRSEERRVGKECRSRWSPYH